MNYAGTFIHTGTISGTFIHAGTFIWNFYIAMGTLKYE
jgi:hypothetical protein